MWGMSEQARTPRGPVTNNQGTARPGSGQLAGVPGALWEVLTQGPGPLPHPLSEVGTVGGGGTEPKGTKRPLWPCLLWAAGSVTGRSAVWSAQK